MSGRPPTGGTDGGWRFNAAIGDAGAQPKWELSPQPYRETAFLSRGELATCPNIPPGGIWPVREGASPPPLAGPPGLQLVEGERYDRKPAWSRTGTTDRCLRRVCAAVLGRKVIDGRLRRRRCRSALGRDLTPSCCTIWKWAVLAQIWRICLLRRVRFGGGILVRVCPWGSPAPICLVVPMRIAQFARRRASSRVARRRTTGFGANHLVHVSACLLLEHGSIRETGVEWPMS
jgi:hypothetical protein